MSDITLNSEKQDKEIVTPQDEEVPAPVDKNDTVVITIEETEEEKVCLEKCIEIDLAEGDTKATAITTGRDFVVYEMLTRTNRASNEGKRFQNKLQNRTTEDEELANGQLLEYDPNTRNGFVSKVMIIVLVMLIATAIPVVVLIKMPRWSFYFEFPFGNIWLSAAVTLDLLLSVAMGCFRCSSRPPAIYILLPLSWLAMTIICIVVCLRTHTQIVLYALATTAVIVLVCIMLACTSYDFTKWMIYMVVVGIAFFVLSIIVVVVQKISGTYMPVLHIVFLFIGTLINVVFLIMELQMVLGGKSIELNEDEYFLAAYMLYNSIVEIFISMIQLLGLLGD